MASAIRRHAGLKLLSVLLAGLMWLLVSGERIVERAMRIPLEFTNLSSDLEVVGGTPEVVDVRVRGSSGALSRIAAGDLVAMIDLSSARQGPRLFNVSGSDVRTPFGIEVMQVSPSSLTIHFERSASKVVPIVPALDGLPADGYVIDDVTVTPPTVEIVGPQSAIQNLKDATTEPVTVTDATGHVADTVTVGVVDPSLRLRAPLNAHVAIKVAPAPMEWAVAQIPVQIRNATGPIEVVPTRITVRVRGSRATMKSGADAFTASVDVAGLQRGQYQLPVQVVPPVGIGVTGVEPEQLVVRVR